MKLAIGCDHAAVDFKNKIIAYLTDLGYTCEDFGTYTDESCDYPVYADKVCNAVTDGGFDKGILICGTGIGMSMPQTSIKAYAVLHAANLFRQSFRVCIMTQMFLRWVRGLSA